MSAERFYSETEIAINRPHACSDGKVRRIDQLTLLRPCRFLLLAANCFVSSNQTGEITDLGKNLLATTGYDASRVTFWCPAPLESTGPFGKREGVKIKDETWPQVPRSLVESQTSGDLSSSGIMIVEWSHILASV